MDSRVALCPSPCAHRTGVTVVALLVAAMVSAGCSSDGAPVDAGSDASSTCAVNADCNDTLFCNGTETCDPDGASADARGCVAGSAPCGPPLVCVEADAMCQSANCDVSADVDGDGHDAVACGGDDCDDGDANRFPGNVEVCDLQGHDEDCVATTFGAVDSDSDSFVDARCCNAAAGGGMNCGNDCNDGRIDVHPIATEACDYFDNNCNGSIDEGVSVPGYVDADFDGRGAASMPITGCAGRAGFSPYSGDCDDSDPHVSDLQPEVCDTIDNDCDGGIDENPRPVPWYPDADMDRFGAIELAPVVACNPPTANHILFTFDCDDTMSSVGPFAPELCNARDDNCNRFADFVVGLGDFEDDDADGHADDACGGTDCDDRSASAYPGAPERDNGRDDDCDGNVDEALAAGSWYADDDGDGFGDPSATMQATTRPSGYVSHAGDCDDMLVGVNPSATEVCDGIDNDCDTQEDEGLRVLQCPDVDMDDFGAATGCTYVCPQDVTGALNASDCNDGAMGIHPQILTTCVAGDADCDGVDDTMYDADGDTVCDGVDQCAGIDDAIDADADGIPDYCDGCPTQGAVTLCDAGYLKAFTPGDEANFGWSVAMEGDVIVVGAPSLGDAGRVGAAYVFERTLDGAWHGVQVLAPPGPNGDPGDEFGRAVGVSGGIIVVGATGEDSSIGGVNTGENEFSSRSGAAFAFLRSAAPMGQAGAWTLEARLKTTGPDSNEEFGFSVDVSGDTAAIGTPGRSTGSGAVQVFRRSPAGVWAREQQLSVSSPDNARFGESVALEGDTLVVGVPNIGSTNVGEGRIFVRSGTTWSAGAPNPLVHAGVASGDRFGDGVALSGQHLFVSAPGLDSDGSSVADNSVMNAGGVLYFRMNAGIDTASFDSLFVAETPTAQAAGSRVQVAGDVVAYNQWDVNGARGAVSLCRWDGTMWSAPTDITRGGDAGDRFGAAIAIGATVVVACAPYEDGDVAGTMGVGGDPSDNAGTDTGACFLIGL